MVGWVDEKAVLLLFLIQKCFFKWNSKGAWWKVQPAVDQEKCSGRHRPGPDWAFHGPRHRPDWGFLLVDIHQVQTELGTGRRRPLRFLVLVDFLVNGRRCRHPFCWCFHHALQKSHSTCHHTWMIINSIFQKMLFFKTIYLSILFHWNALYVSRITFFALCVCACESVCMCVCACVCAFVCIYAIVP